MPKINSVSPTFCSDAQIREIAEVIGLPRRVRKGFGTDEVSAMRLGAMLARDEPPRPPVGNWGALINVLHLALSIEFAR